MNEEEIIIKYKPDTKCKSCSKLIVPDEIHINEHWGTKQQVEQQGATVGKFNKDVCRKCVNEGKGNFYCDECEKEYPMKDLKFTYLERYAEEESKVCINCYNKMDGKKVIKRMVGDNFEVRWMRS